MASSATADMMDHVLAQRGGVNSKFKVGREATPRVSRFKAARPTLVIHLPGGASKRATPNDNKPVKAKVVSYVQWADPVHLRQHRMSFRASVKGITGKLQYQGVDAAGKPVWA